MDAHAGIMLLNRKLLKGQELLDSWKRLTAVNENAYRAWVSTTGECLNRIFGEEAIVERFWNISPSRTGVSSLYSAALKHQIAEVENAIEILGAGFAPRSGSTTADQQSKHRDLTKVFIVHGHDGELKEATARVVAQLGLKPVILHEQSNQGRTIIEKFASHAQEVGFAIVLLSADDEGRSKAASSDALKPRARQNVVFELGFFFGSLGRERVCPIYEEGVELPSDVHGYAYIKYDRGSGWRYALARELKSAGYEVDLNKL